MFHLSSLETIFFINWFLSKAKSHFPSTSKMNNSQRGIVLSFVSLTHFKSFTHLSLSCPHSFCFYLTLTPSSSHCLIPSLFLSVPHSPFFPISLSTSLYLFLWILLVEMCNWLLLDLELRLRNSNYFEHLVYFCANKQTSLRELLSVKI